MLTAKQVRTGAASIGLVIGGGLAIAMAVAVVTAPLTPRLAIAQTLANPNDQPNAATLPSGIDTVKRNRDPGSQPTGNVSPPSRITSSTDVVGSTKGSGRTNPLDHLSPEYRSSQVD